MPEFTDDLRREVAERIHELEPVEAELARLRALMAELDDDPRWRRSVASGAGVGPRQRQVLELVSRRPGITVQEVSSELRVNVPALYRPIRRLAASGHVRRRGRQLFLAG